MADEDLRNNPSPFASGVPHTDQRSSDYPVGAVPGYYSPGALGNNANADGNPLAASAPPVDSPSSYIVSGLDNLYAETLDLMRGSKATPDYQLDTDLLTDEGQDDQLVPKGKRS